MSTVTTEQVKALREKTSLSIMQCKKALEEADGDIEKAIVILQKQSGAVADKKSDRTLGAGTVASYIHQGGTVGSIVELSCETDFVAKNAEFQTLAYDLAMHVAASDPLFLKMDDIDADARKVAEEVFIEETKGKPEELKAKILEGKLKSYFGEKTLLEQVFIKNQDMIIKDLISGYVQKFGERIEVRRFIRFSTKS